jgi:phosphopantetheinyl transferase (holo-ACP synthase)
MAGAADPFEAQRGEPTRCGIDSVEIARIERLLRETPSGELTRFFSPQELADSGDGPGRATPAR